MPGRKDRAPNGSLTAKRNAWFEDTRNRLRRTVYAITEYSQIRGFESDGRLRSVKLNPRELSILEEDCSEVIRMARQNINEVI